MVMTRKERLARQKARRARNKERIREYNRKYREANREKCVALTRAWLAKNQTRRRAWEKKYYQKNLEENRARSRSRGRQRRADPETAEQIRKYHREWCRSHPDRMPVYAKRWRGKGKNLEKIREWGRKRGARPDVMARHNKHARERYDRDPEPIRKRNRINKRRNVENLTDGYVREVIIGSGPNKSSLRAADVPQELVELKRAEMQLRRATNDQESRDDERVKGTGSGDAGGS